MLRWIGVTLFSVEALATRLLPGPGDPPPADGQRRAAVAVLIRDGAVLLMRRAERKGDPWSGHVSLPGGRFEPSDHDLLTTAIRESHEELGIVLDRDAGYLGRLAPLHPRNAGPSGMEVTAFVFVTDAVPDIRLSPEAVATCWLPLADVAAGALDAIYEYPGPPAAMRFPSWRFEDFTIWGLTMRILGELLTQGHL
jgi:8-oxo-dGTP pyrophosphatase MutT (NUDIX family)